MRGGSPPVQVCGVGRSVRFKEGIFVASEPLNQTLQHLKAHAPAAQSYVVILAVEMARLRKQPAKQQEDELRRWLAFDSTDTFLSFDIAIHELSAGMGEATQALRSTLQLDRARYLRESP